jgi:uncharacterized repeat protein (TIGR03803 family)
MKTSKALLMAVVCDVTLLALGRLAPVAHGGVTLTTLHSFSGPDGANPASGLVLGQDGNFYGTTSANDIPSTNYGSVFRITPGGVLTNLYQFAGGDDGAYPQTGLVLGSDGNLYGTTPYHGAFGWGTIFKISPSGDFATLVSLDSSAGSPGSLLVAGTDGNFYVVGNFGFGTGLGSVFSVTPGGVTNVLTYFYGTNGFTGWSSSRDMLLLGPDGNFYGATQYGGARFRGEFAYPACGTVFQMAPDGTLTTLASLDGTNGAGVDALIQGRDGDLYGLASNGGPGFIDHPAGGSGGDGTIFKVTTNGTLSAVAFFNSTNGSGPGSIMQASDGNFYGTTGSGGTNGGHGTVFKMTADGTLTSLLSFNGTNGANPAYATLVQVADGTFYGTTDRGGPNNLGTVFRLTLTPDPPVFQSVTPATNALVLTWTTAPGRSYQVQFTTDLIHTNWTSLGPPITATNTSAVASDTLDPDPQRFYRVLLLP